MEQFSFGACGVIDMLHWLMSCVEHYVVTDRGHRHRKGTMVCCFGIKQVGGENATSSPAHDVHEIPELYNYLEALMR